MVKKKHGRSVKVAADEQAWLNSRYGAIFYKPSYTAYRYGGAYGTGLFMGSQTIVSLTVDHFCVYDHRFYAFFVMRAMGNCCSRIWNINRLAILLPTCLALGGIFHRLDVPVLLGSDRR